MSRVHAYQSMRLPTMSAAHVTFSGRATSGGGSCEDFHVMRGAPDRAVGSLVLCVRARARARARAGGR